MLHLGDVVRAYLLPLLLLLCRQPLSVSAITVTNRSLKEIAELGSHFRVAPTLYARVKRDLKVSFYMFDEQQVVETSMEN